MRILSPRRARSPRQPSILVFLAQALEIRTFCRSRALPALPKDGLLLRSRRGKFRACLLQQQLTSGLMTAGWLGLTRRTPRSSRSPWTMARWWRARPTSPPASLATTSNTNSLFDEDKACVRDVKAGQAVITHAGEWVQYSTPDPEGAEYIAICLPAFSPDTVHRDAEPVPAK